MGSDASFRTVVHRGSAPRPPLALLATLACAPAFVACGDDGGSDGGPVGGRSAGRGGGGVAMGGSAATDGGAPPSMSGGAASGGAASGGVASGGIDSGEADSGGTGGDPGSDGGAAPVDLCTPTAGDLDVDVTALTVTNLAGEAPVKGDRLRITVTVANTGTGVGPVRLTPRLEATRFSDYTDVPVGTVEGTACSGETQLVVEAGPFLDDEARSKHYALGRSAYTVTAVDVAVDDVVTTDGDFAGGAFEVGASSALLIPVIYDQGYFDAIQGLTTTTPEAYLEQAFQRSTQLFTPDDGGDPDGAGTYQSYPGGFDEMMGVRHHFRAFAGFPGDSVSDEGWCEDAIYWGRDTLGMDAEWTAAPQGTQPERHGFDYLLALHPGLGGGVACGWIDVQVSGLIFNDVDRQQIVAVHESAHIFGSPHCDDVGNGSGGPLQGYVMCSGEKHPNYPEQFVFHTVSRATMSSKWD